MSVCVLLSLILSLVTRFYLRGTQIGVLGLRSHTQWDEGPEHCSQWSGGQKTRRVNAALIRGTAVCVVSGCSVFYQMLGARVWGWIPPPSSTLLLWSFPHNDILLWVIPGRNQLRGRPRTDCSCSAGLCLVSLTLSKADHAIPSTPPAGQERDPFTVCLPRRLSPYSNLYFPGSSSSRVTAITVETMSL